MPTNRQLIEELLKRRGIVEACFDKQREPVLGALERSEKQIAILTSRRAGKTNTVLRALCRDALDNPRRKYAYIGLSRVTAENIVWKELEEINENHSLHLELQGYRLRAIFPNGSDITLYGADQPGWVKKFKGAKYRSVVIDEAGEFDIDLQDFIYRVIRPTLVDLRGTLWLIGTPGIITSGFWWKVTNPDPSIRLKKWDFYTWHSRDNPFIVEQFNEELQELHEEFGDALYDLPWYRREWLGEWCTDTSNNVYNYDPEKCAIENWEPSLGDQYLLGVDPGYSDAAAFVVAVYNPEKDDKLVFIDCYKEIGMLMGAMADRVEAYMQKYPGIRIIGDPDSAHFLAELRTRRSIPVEDAKKVKKQQAIQVMNSYLAAGKIKYLMPNCMPYAKEIMELKKDFQKSDERIEDGVTLGVWKEHPRMPNDLCDAGLYVARAALQWTYAEPTPKVQYGSEDYYDEVANNLKKQAITKAMGGAKPWWKK